MDTLALIPSKLHPPGFQGQWLEWPRLLAQLERGLERGFCLISAPAGYGKTMLAAHWLESWSPLDWAWLSLDRGDNDLYLFLAYLIAGVRSVFPDKKPLARTIRLLSATQPPVETITHTLINDLDNLPRPLILALDDYHVVTNPAIHEIMGKLINYLPAGLRLLLISRMDPPVSMLARLRGQQRIAEIRTSDLRFSPAETRAILALTTGGTVDESIADRLQAQTEGWIIGLQLAGISLRDQPDPDTFTRSIWPATTGW